MFSALKTGRSLAASYNLQNDIQRMYNLHHYSYYTSDLISRSAVFIRVQTDAEAALFESQTPTIVALTKNCKSAKVVREPSEIPPGCGSTVLSPTVVVYLLVRVSDRHSFCNVTCANHLSLFCSGRAWWISTSRSRNATRNLGWRS